jgi:arabinose-5-phosphate isomerase
MASLFSSTGTSCYFLDGTETTHGSAGQVREGDVVIAISYYGNVAELVAAVKTLKKNGAFIIGVTGFPESEIAKMADVHLDVHVEKEGDYLNKPPRISMLVTLFMLMNLSLILQAKKGLDHEAYLKWHPSGQLGKREGL